MVADPMPIGPGWSHSGRQVRGMTSGCGARRIVVKGMSGAWLRAAAVVSTFCLTIILSTLPALANNKYAAIVIDEVTGEVLFSRKADLPRFPASLTKVMTLYLLFEEIDSGRLKLSDSLKASKRAAGQPPSKLGLRAGQKIKVDEVIRALVIRSANDVAVVVAEHISGTESQFARRMTNRARSLGMSNTRFRNASGLPNNSQTTTARDMAILGQRMRKDFPHYTAYFNETSFRWGGRTWKTHNKVLVNYDGADGMKTGYTRASGFNLLTSAKRHGTRVIAVVMGGKTAQRRDREMARILDLNFKRIAANPKYRERLLASLPRPLRRPEEDPLARVAGLSPIPVPAPAGESDTPERDVPRPTALARADDPIADLLSNQPTRGASRPKVVAGVQEPAEDPIGEEIARSANLALAIPVAPSPSVEGSLQPDTQGTVDLAALNREAAQRRRSVNRSGLTLTLDNAPATSPESASQGTDDTANIGEGDGRPLGNYELLADVQSSGVGIQIGAFLRITTAMRYIQNAITLVPDVLSNNNAAIVQSKTDSGDIFRARFGPFNEDQANTACGLLEARGMECFSVKDDNWDRAIRPK